MEELMKVIVIILIVLLLLAKCYANLHGESAQESAPQDKQEKENKEGGVKMIIIYPDKPYIKKNNTTHRIRNQSLKVQYQEWVRNAKEVNEVMKRAN